MGIYINKRNPTDWVETHGIKYKNIPQWETFSTNCVPVILIKNIIDTVAAIAYNEKEYEILTKKDKREKVIYEVPMEDLLTISRFKFCCINY